MPEHDTFWLIVTNIVLGALVAFLLGFAACAVVCHLVTRWRHRRTLTREVDRDWEHYFGRK